MLGHQSMRQTRAEDSRTLDQTASRVWSASKSTCSASASARTSRTMTFARPLSST